MVSASSNPHEQQLPGSQIFSWNHGAFVPLILLPCSIAIVHEKHSTSPRFYPSAWPRPRYPSSLPRHLHQKRIDSKKSQCPLKKAPNHTTTHQQIALVGAGGAVGAMIPIQIPFVSSCVARVQRHRIRVRVVSSSAGLVVGVCFAFVSSRSSRKCRRCGVVNRKSFRKLQR